MFSEMDWNDIQCALEVAGEQYEKDAATNAGNPCGHATYDRTGESGYPRERLPQSHWRYTR